ncbi:MAG: T9SS type A sorting domain-containing protein [bacterium]
MKYFIILLFFIPISIFSNKLVLKHFDGESLQKGGGIAMSVDCPDSLNCFMLTQSGEYHRLFKSTNQGNTWELIYQSESLMDQIKQGITVLMGVEDGCSPHPDYYFMSFNDEGFLKKSSDGGKTFERIDLKEKYRIYSINMLDSSIGIAYSALGNIYLTYDGWKTWEIKSTPVLNDSTWISGFFSPQFKDSNTIIGLSPLLNPLDTVDYGYGIKMLYDYGQVFFSWNYKTDKWSYVLFPTTYYDVNDTLHPDTCDAFRMINFVNDSIGFVCGGKGYGIGDAKYDLVYKTKDGGKAWEKVFENFDKKLSAWGLQEISFKDELNGVAVGAIGVVLVTGDGGETWEYLDKPDTLLNRQPLTAIVTWAGEYPIIGTYGAGFWRIEGPNGGPPVFKKATKSAIIQAENYDFGTIDVKDTSLIIQKIKIHNLSTDTNLIISSFSNLSESAFTNEFVWLDTMTNISVKPSDFFELPVSFKPNEVRKYNDSIVVHSNAIGQDSVIILEGEGIDTSTSVHDEHITTNKFTISPNPASEYIEIKLSESSELSESYPIQIFNLYGEKMTIVVQNFESLRIDISSFPVGMYFVKISESSELSGSYRIQKFVVIK